MKKVLFSNTPVLKQLIQSVSGVIEPVFDPTAEYDFVHLGMLPNAVTLWNSIPEDKKAGLNIDIMSKTGIISMIVESGLNQIESYNIIGEQTIRKFKNKSFIIKPNLSHSSFDPYNFTYKIYKNSSQFFNSIDPAEFERFISSGDYNNYIIQQSIADSNGLIHQLFVAGFVNSKCEIFHEGVTDAFMVQDKRQEEERLNTGGEQTTRDSKYLHNFIRLENTYNDSNDLNDYYGFISQIQKLFLYFGMKNFSFICQALVDPDDTKCYVIDFAYKIRPFNYEVIRRREYLQDKMRYVYYDEPVKIIDDEHFTYPNLDIPKGITLSLENFLNDNDIQCDLFGNKLNRRSMPFAISGKTRAEMQDKLNKLKLFLSSDY